MKIVIAFVLIYLKMCNCLRYQQRFISVGYDNSPRIENYPWIVIISTISTQKMLSFGSLIHPSVVLTHASLDAYSLYFDFKVLAKCFFNYHDVSVMSSYECQYTKYIKEYSVIEVNAQGNDRYWHNLALLILLEPFKITSNVYPISLARDRNEFDPRRCYILYLMQLSNSHPVNEPMFDFQTQIEYEGNYPRIRINWLGLENKYIDKADSLDLPGSQVICLTKFNGGHWVLAFLLHASIYKNNVTQQFNSYSEMRDITYCHKTEMIDTIIRNAGLSI